MNNIRDSIVYEKAFKFAIKIVNIYKQLCDNKKEYILSKQLLRAGTSIGANIREGLEGQSKKDFVAKVSISLKEAVETEYWLELLLETEYLEKEMAEKLISDARELIRILSSIIQTSKQNLK